MKKKTKTMSWAEEECRLACKRENPNFDFDSDDFDYGCSCYKSALKAYNAMSEDGHSGASWGFTKNILIRLLNHQPLSPITEEDFKFNGCDTFYSDEYLKSRNLKSHIQCPRYSALFRSEYLDGKVTYNDVDRAYFIDIENESNTWSGDDSFLDEMFPITLPYIPPKTPFKIFAQEFLCDEKNGDFDTRGILYIITPDGEKIEINKFEKEQNGHWCDITKEEYEDRLLNKRIDTVKKKSARDLLWTLISNSASDEEIEKREKAWRELFSSDVKDRLEELLCKKCSFFEKEENYKYNTFSMRQYLCNFDDNTKTDLPKELIEIKDFLKQILDKVKECY